MHTERQKWAILRPEISKKLLRPAAIVVFGVACAAPDHSDTQPDHQIATGSNESGNHHRVLMAEITKADLTPEERLNQNRIYLQNIATDNQPATPAVIEQEPATAGVSAQSSIHDNSVWDRLSICEASGDWHINTGNGYYGGLQFSLSTWQSVEGTGLPSDATREEQIMRGEMLQARSGWGQWPACSEKLGLR